MEYKYRHASLSNRVVILELCHLWELRSVFRNKELQVPGQCDHAHCTMWTEAPSGSTWVYTCVVESRATNSQMFAGEPHACLLY